MLPRPLYMQVVYTHEFNMYLVVNECFKFYCKINVKKIQEYTPNKSATYTDINYLKLLNPQLLPYSFRYVKVLRFPIEQPECLQLPKIHPKYSIFQQIYVLLNTLG